MNKTIVVIDDDEVFCQTLCRALQRRGYEAFFAVTGEDAMQRVKARGPAYAVLDLRLGEDSGLQLIRPLLDAAPGLRIVVLTGYASLTTAVQAVKLGAVNYLAKPVDAGAILRALTEAADEPDANVAELAPTPLKQLEWEHLQRVLAENHGNISATARQLGMHRRTLQRKLQKKPGINNDIE